MSAVGGRADSLCSERVIPSVTQSRLSTSRQLRNRLRGDPAVGGLKFVPSARA